MPPVGFFAYPGKPSRMYPADCTIHVLARPEQDGPRRWRGWRPQLRCRPGGAAAGAEPAPAAGAGRGQPEALAQSSGRAAAGGGDRGG